MNPLASRVMEAPEASSGGPRIDPYRHGSRYPADEVIAALKPHVTERRWARMQRVLDRRTRYLTVAVEDIYQPHNASAVLRSCDAFGVQDVHIIENRNRYHVNPGVELGTAQWLSLYRYPLADEASHSTVRAVRTLRRLGYRIVATTPHRDDVTLDEFDLQRGPTALLFGAEKEGLSETALAQADEYMRIPMQGFVESLNISVSAAISLQALAGRLRASELGWRLSAGDRSHILARWLRRSVRHASGILARELDGA